MPSVIRLSSPSDAYHVIQTLSSEDTYAYRMALLLSRSVVVENHDGNITILNSDTNSAILQGSASDGSGSGFDLSAILWIAFTFTIGLFLATIGVRGWRVTTGVALGLALAVSSWAAFINTVNSVGISDITLSLLVLGFFVVGLVGGVFEIGRLAGMAALGICGGLSLGIRIVLFRSGLLIPTFFLDWLVIAFLGVLGLCTVFFRQRIGILAACALSGTFLFFLGVDLVVNKQNGMSLGLRVLFDQNSAHLATFVAHGYNPSLSSQIFLAVSLALSPALAYGQHWLFPQPFDRTARPESVPDLSMLYPDKSENRSPSSLGSRFSV